MSLLYAEMPPLGVRPRHLHDEARLHDLLRAITRHADIVHGWKRDDLRLIAEWTGEAHEIAARLSARAVGR